MGLALTEFNNLVDQHGPTLFRVAYRMVGDRHEAEDLVQDTFRSVWKSRARFVAEQGERAWLLAILRRRVVDHWRKRPVPRPFASDTPPDVPVDGLDPLAHEFTDEMQHALDQLPTELRETLLLVVVGELTHQEVSELLDVPLGTVLSRVSRARERLRTFLLTAASK